MQAIQKKVRTMGSINSITNFGDVGAFTVGDGNDVSKPKQYVTEPSYFVYRSFEFVDMSLIELY